MQLGFVSAILPELSFRELFEFAAESGYDCVEVMCWPVSKAERRYAGITHLDVTSLSDDTIAEVEEVVRSTGVSISGLGMSAYIRRQIAGEFARFFPPGHSSFVNSMGQFSIPIFTPRASAWATSGRQVARN